MVVEDAQFVDLRRGRSDFLTRGDNVFAILPAAGIRTERAGEEGEGSLDAIAPHSGEGLWQQRMPVAIAPIDRQFWTVDSEFLLKRRDESAVLIIDWADAAEVLVMLGDFKHSFPRHGLAAENVFEKGHDLVGPLRSAERDDQDGVVGGQGILDLGLVINDRNPSTEAATADAIRFRL